MHLLLFRLILKWHTSTLICQTNTINFFGYTLTRDTFEQCVESSTCFCSRANVSRTLSLGCLNQSWALPESSHSIWEYWRLNIYRTYAAAFCCGNEAMLSWLPTGSLWDLGQIESEFFSLYPVPSPIKKLKWG